MIAKGPELESVDRIQQASAETVDGDGPAILNADPQTISSASSETPYEASNASELLSSDSSIEHLVKEASRRIEEKRASALAEAESLPDAEALKNSSPVLSREKPSRLGWRDDPKRCVKMFDHDCDMLAQDFNNLPDVIDRLNRKQREKIGRRVWDLCFEMLGAFEELGAISHEQRECLFNELSAAISCIEEKAIAERIVAAVQKRHAEGEVYDYAGYDTWTAARDAYKAQLADGCDADSISLVGYEACGVSSGVASPA